MLSAKTMKNFFNKYKNIIIILIYVEIALLPTQILLFYKDREFVDIGMLISAVLLVIFTVPVYNLVKRQSDKNKGL